eukprot:Plantae.Rhodophyta-Purpureofilum_apyrenoidigerum.ctg20273.p1 GENE.Plantae.Rhodophyta-Purpureofilum_apyrenoidigerum.ctg20273~~Plantae.Rhodophyta-Purpureofilum_apyrenoidigerum.ctg20273.p1  ORF type:complete len:654 (+),score=118.74 Plantae.Rhodophyta-Purpureofilum_apyrenoidigerum.ctg20273:100-1962(+)
MGNAEAERRNSFSWEPCGARVVSTVAGEEPFQCRASWPGMMHISVALEKPLSWDADKREWRWHKTWRLPEICVRVVDKEARSNLEVRLSIVCFSAHSNELDDVGLSTLEGGHYALSQLVDSECRFSRLRLIGTSNTHGGRRFHFLVSVVQKDALGNQEVLASLISSAFSVYSRKDADKKRKKTELAGDSTEGSTFAAFSPELFTRVFVKKISDHNGCTLEEQIDNSWAGLMRYFQAPNIRFKSRHPLLLAVRFSQVIVILRDGQHFSEENEFTFRNFLCACGFPQNCRTQNCLSCYVRQNGPIEHRDGTFLSPWHISIRRDDLRPLEASRWITEHLSGMRSNTLGFIQDPSMLPERYVPTESLAEMRDLYTRLYALNSTAKGANDRQTGKNIRMEAPRGGLGLPVSMMVPVPAPSISKQSEAGMQDTMYRTLGEKRSQEMSSALINSSDSSMKAQFAEFFVGLHSEMRALLNAFTEASSLIVTDCSEENIQQLRNSYFNFTKALAVHSHMEDTTLFLELTKRVPGVAEAYNYDHYRESEHLTQIHDAINCLEAHEAAELFLKISGFAALDNEHMEKEEEHLMPYFLTHFSDDELVGLMRAAEAAVNDMRIGQGIDVAVDM